MHIIVQISIVYKYSMQYLLSILSQFDPSTSGSQIVQVMNRIINVCNRLNKGLVFLRD